MPRPRTCRECGMQEPYHLWGCPEAPEDNLDEDTVLDDRDPDELQGDDDAECQAG